MRESPEKYKWHLEHPEPATPSLLFGAMVHKLLLEPIDFEDEYAVAPPIDRRTNAGKEAWKQFISQIGNRTIVTQDDFDVMAGMVEKAKSIPYVREILKGEHEVPLFWTDDDTGLTCKVRLDILANNGLIVADYKTANNAKTEAFNSKIFEYGYHLQAYMYTEAVMKCYGLTERPEFVFIVQEKKPPYSVNLIQVTEDVMMAGMDCFREYIGMVKQCTDTGYWYGYNGLYGEPNEAFLPGWMQIGEDE